MRSIVACLLILATGGSLADALTPAERNIAWVAEIQNWKKAVANWKKSVEANCNVSDADKYWREAFTCPDVPDVTCHNYDAREVVVDELDCSTTICKDGFYTDQMAFLDMWRQYLDTHKTMMSIHENKLVDCTYSERKGLDSEAALLEAWNSQSLKYSELSMALLKAKGDIENLQNISKDMNTITENYSDLSTAVLEVNRLTAKLENHSKAWNEQREKNSELMKAVDQLKLTDSQTQARVDESDSLSKMAAEKADGVHASMEDLVINVQANKNETEKLIQALENENAAQNQKHTELSNSVKETNEKITQLQNPAFSYCPLVYNGKCFWMEYRDPRVLFEQGKEICIAKEGRLADIYSEEHYFMLLGYVRMFAMKRGMATAWTGMTYNHQTNTVSLSDGTPAPYVKWFREYPQSAYSINIWLEANMEWNTANQHMLNAHGSWTAFGAICEK